MDFDDAYENSAYIPDGPSYPDGWAEAAKSFRSQASCALDVAYGDTARQTIDFFYPEHAPKGLAVFVHGGYWLRFDKSYWSHLAAGPLARGWVVAMPSYDLCPQARITQIGAQIAKAVAFAAARVSGPVRLAGHSAGGHLVARVPSIADAGDWPRRLEKIIPISPVADLAPLMQTKMNATLGLTAEEAERESPINLPPPSCPVSVWVGAAERPVFLAQAAGLAAAWGCSKVVAPGLHHFNVIEGLADPDSPLTAEFCA